MAEFKRAVHDALDEVRSSCSPKASSHGAQANVTEFFSNLAAAATREDEDALLDSGCTNVVEDLWGMAEEDGETVEKITV